MFAMANRKGKRVGEENINPRATILALVNICMIYVTVLLEQVCLVLTFLNPNRGLT